MTSIHSRKRRSNEDEAEFAEARAFSSFQSGAAVASSPGQKPIDGEQSETKTSYPTPTAGASRPIARISARSYTPSRLGVASTPLEKRDPEAAPAPNRFLGRILNRNGSPGPKSTTAQTPARASPIPSRLRAERKSTLASTPSSPKQSSPRTPQGEDWVATQSTKRSRVLDEGDLISSAPRSGRANSARGTPSSAARLKAFVENIFSPLYKLFPRRQKGHAAAATLPATAKTLFPDADAATTAALITPLPLTLPTQSAHPAAATAAAAASQGTSPARLGAPVQLSPSTPALASPALTLLNGHSLHPPSQSLSTTGVVLGVSPGRARPGSPAAREQHEYVAGINLQDEEFLFMAEFLWCVRTPCVCLCVCVCVCVCRCLFRL
jgi:hypothetical protein